MFNEEDINDGESEEKLKSKTANLEGLLSKVNGKSIFKKNKKMFENTRKNAGKCPDECWKVPRKNLEKNARTNAGKCKEKCKEKARKKVRKDVRRKVEKNGKEKCEKQVRKR